MEGAKCVARFKSGNNKGEPCSHRATRGNLCGLHAPKVAAAAAPPAAVAPAPKTKKKDAKRNSLPGWLLQFMSGRPQREEEEGDDEATEDGTPAVVCALPPRRVRTGCSSERRVGVMPVDNTIYVCNVEGSSEDKGAWKPFCTRGLATVGEEYPTVCRVKDCQRKVSATGHMYWRDCKGTPDGWRYNYLAGICSHHNSSAYNNKYVPLKKGHVVIIEENPVVSAAVQKKRTARGGGKKK